MANMEGRAENDPRDIGADGLTPEQRQAQQRDLAKKIELGRQLVPQEAELRKQLAEGPGNGLQEEALSALEDQLASIDAYKRSIGQ